jgi:hypothetical protein
MLKSDLVRDSGYERELDCTALQNADDADKRQNPRQKQSGPQDPGKNDVRDKDRHLTYKNNQSLFAVGERKGVAFFKDQRDDA